MGQVTWGANTVHTFAGAAPSAAAPGFGATPAPAPGFGGATPSPAAPFSFGTPAAPSPGGLFGTPAPSPGGIFGAPTTAFGTAPSTSLFGSPKPAPAPVSVFGSSAPAGGGLFGTKPASVGLFGTPAPASPFSFGAPSPSGAPPPTVPPQNQIPAQAALQAHLDASKRQEEAKVKAALETLFFSYMGTTMVAPTDKQSSPFCSILYNPATPEMRQQQWLTGMGVDGTPKPVAPPRPPQVSTHDWNQAVVRNPDWQQYMPVALVGAESLQARLTGQQEQAAVVARQLKSIRESQEMVQERWKHIERVLEDTGRQHELRSKRLLDIMRKVELARCFGHPLQHDEVKAMAKLADVLRHVEALRGLTEALREEVAVATSTATTVVSQPTILMNGIPDPAKLKQILKEHRDGLASITSTVQKDVRDLALVRDRVDSVTKQQGGKAIALPMSTTT